MNETASSVTKSFTIEIKKQKDVIAKIPKEYLDVQDQVQADWNQTDTDAKDYIKNKPDAISYPANGSFNAGKNASATDQNSFASGNSTASGQYSSALGKSIATGRYSVATGYVTSICGLLSPKNEYLFNFGDSKAEGRYSHAEGQQTASIGQASHAEGSCSIAYGSYSQAIGYCTVATGKSQHVIGELNEIDGDTNDAGEYIGGGTTHATNQRTTYVEIVGNGTVTDDGDAIIRSNARTLDWSGNEWLSGNLTAAGGSITIGSTTITEVQLQALLATLS